MIELYAKCYGKLKVEGVSLLRDFDDSFIEEVMLEKEQEFMIREECSSQRIQHVDVACMEGQEGGTSDTQITLLIPNSFIPCHFSSYHCSPL